MKNQGCKVRLEIINVNSDKPTFYLYSVKINKCSGSCNNINNTDAKTSIPDVVVKTTNVKVFNLILKTN